MEKGPLRQGMSFLSAVSIVSRISALQLLLSPTVMALVFRFTWQGSLNRDYTLVMGVVVFYGTLIIAFNFFVDLLYGWLDPRVRL